MIELTAEAKTRLNDYLERMRSALRGSRAVEPDEVEQNVREHVDIALAGIPAPVGSESLARVLEQLGPPERWLPDDDRPMWKRVASRLMAGPEDWRLPYLSFTVTFLMFALFPVGGIFLLVPAYLLSRAYIDLQTERGEPLDARRWLVLPPVFFVAVFVIGAALFAPIAGFDTWINEDSGAAELMAVHGVTLGQRDSLVAGYVLLFAGSWWIVLSGIYAVVHDRLLALIKPFGARWKRVHALILTGQGIVLASIGAYALYRFIW